MDRGTLSGMAPKPSANQLIKSLGLISPAQRLQADHAHTVIEREEKACCAAAAAEQKRLGLAA